MNPSLTPLNRFFVCSDYSAFYRRVKRLEWESQTTSDYALLTVRKGRVHYGTPQRELAESECLLLEPNCVIKAVGEDLESLLLTFSSSLLIQHAVTMRLIPSQSTVTFPEEPINAQDKLRRLLADLTVELLSEEPGREIVMRALVDQVLIDLLRNYSRTRRCDELELSRVGMIDRRIRRSVELIYTQLDQDLSLRDLAAASYLSPFHFARLFKKLTGTTPHNYLAAVRTSRARLLLAETDYSITEIGSRVGYLSASHFTKAFRLATGTTPREFRKSLVAR